MNKKLNEQISRIKSMMKMINEEDFESNEYNQPSKEEVYKILNDVLSNPSKGNIELEHYPSVTIIVPCYNEALSITATIKRLKESDSNLKIIVSNQIHHMPMILNYFLQ